MDVGNICNCLCSGDGAASLEEHVETVSPLATARTPPPLATAASKGSASSSPTSSILPPRPARLLSSASPDGADMAENHRGVLSSIGDMTPEHLRQLAALAPLAPIAQATTQPQNGTGIGVQPPAMRHPRPRSKMRTGAGVSKPSILIPSRRGCAVCEPSLCVEYFEHCTDSSAISVHCMDRTSVFPFLSVFSLFVIVWVLALTACFRRNKRVRRSVKKMREWLHEHGIGPRL